MAYNHSLDAELALIQFEKDLLSANELVGVVEKSLNETRRKQLDLAITRNDLNESFRKARENAKRIEAEIRIAKAEFWRLKNGGL